jgi:hypothetical protein
MWDARERWPESAARIILSGVEFMLMIRKGKMRDDGARNSID